MEVVARSAGPERLDPARLGELTLTSRTGRVVPLSQIGHVEIRPEDPILRRRDRTPTITVQSDFDEAMQPPEVSMEIEKALAPIIRDLPIGYRIETGGNIEDSAKANSALLPVFPIMVLLTLLVLVLQTRSLSAMTMVFLTAPLGLVGAVPILLILHQPFGFNAILGLIGLSGILMRNTLILIGQIHTNEAQGLDPYHAVVEATVQRARPVILTALAAVLAFIPLTTSVFWGSMACTLIGGTAAGTVLTLLFLPALYAIWFRVRKPATTTRRGTLIGYGMKCSGLFTQAGQSNSLGVVSLAVSPLQFGTASTLRAFSVVQIAHLDLASRCDLKSGATAGVDAIPQRVTGLRADELLLELARAPGANRKARLLSLDFDLQRGLNKFRRPLSLGGLAAQISKCAGPKRYRNLNPVEWPNPFARQVCLRSDSNSCHRQKKNPQFHRIAFCQVGLPCCGLHDLSEVAAFAPTRGERPLRHAIVATGRG